MADALTSWYGMRQRARGAAPRGGQSTFNPSKPPPALPNQKGATPNVIAPGYPTTPQNTQPPQGFTPIQRPDLPPRGPNPAQPALTNANQSAAFNQPNEPFRTAGGGVPRTGMGEPRQSGPYVPQPPLTPAQQAAIQAAQNALNRSSPTFAQPQVTGNDQRGLTQAPGGGTPGQVVNRPPVDPDALYLQGLRSDPTLLANAWAQFDAARDRQQKTGQMQLGLMPPPIPRDYFQRGAQTGVATGTQPQPPQGFTPMQRPDNPREVPPPPNEPWRGGGGGVPSVGRTPPWVAPPPALPTPPVNPYAGVAGPAVSQEAQQAAYQQAIQSAGPANRYIPTDPNGRPMSRAQYEAMQAANPGAYPTPAAQIYG